jgi:hypothetical protein
LNLCHRLTKAGAAADLPAPVLPYLQFGHTLDIIHIIYNPSDDQSSTSDAEFSRRSVFDPPARPGCGTCAPHWPHLLGL